MITRPQSPDTSGPAPAQRTVLAVFGDATEASRALNDLRDAGFDSDQISVVAKDSRVVAEVQTEESDVVPAAGTGAFLGGITGGILGWLAGIGALIIPGIGPVVAAGILGTALAAAAGGAAVGAVAGGLIGAFVGLGIPEDEARVYEESVRAGRILVAVNPTSPAQMETARDVLGRHGGGDIRSYGELT